MADRVSFCRWVVLLWSCFCAGRSTWGQTEGDRAIAVQRIEEARLALAAGDFPRVADLVRSAVEHAEDQASLWQQAGELMYRSGHPTESLPLFDRAIELDPELLPYNWQRGVALATCGQWAKGAEQFDHHRRVNPDDVENSAWHFLCVAHQQGLPAAVSKLIPSRGDPRPPMMDILRMLRGELPPAEMIEAAEQHDAELASVPGQACFYAHLYAGLYADARGETRLALQHLERAQQIRIRGYMPDVARVYLQTLRQRAADPHDRNGR